MAIGSRSWPSALNEDYADRLGVPMYGYTTGKTMYGEHKAYQGRVDRLALGGLRVGNVPVHTIPEAIRLTAPDGRVTRGAIGTSVLAHFLSTIDYPGRALVLRRDKRAFVREAQRALVVPGRPLPTGPRHRERPGPHGVLRRHRLHRSPLPAPLSPPPGSRSPREMGSIR